MKVMMRSTHRTRPPRKVVIITAVVLVIVAAIGVYWYASAATWQHYDARTQNHMRSVREQTSILVNDGTSLEEKRQAITALSGSDSTKQLCDTAWWYGWQANIASNTGAVERCRHSADYSRTVKSEAATVAALLKNETTLQEIIAAVNPGTKKLTESSWEAAHKKVHSAMTTLATGDFSLEKDYTPVFDEASKRLTALDKAWHSLIGAHAKKDEAAFVGAVDTLDQRYKGLTAIAEASDKVLGEHLEVLSRQL